ncbi:MAG: HAD-IIIA family hydrolase [Myxococcales bacterium]|nr:HAD-IIIA family hydrolase [Myxococcales bacterium]
MNPRPSRSPPCSPPASCPIPGATRVESVAHSAAALTLPLDAAELARLDAAFPELATQRPPLTAPPPAEAEAVLLLGSPAAGKSSRVQPLVDRGYVRLNRDDLGGTLDQLVPLLARAHETGARHFVLDNTYGTRKSRAALLTRCAELNLPTRAVWLDAPEEAAQFNAARRLLARYGRHLDPRELQRADPDAPNTFPPVVISTYQRSFEPPTVEEGFAAVERVPYARVLGPEYRHRALLLDYDGTLRISTGRHPYPTRPEEVQVLPGRAEILQRFRDAGWRLLGVSNQSGIAAGTLTPEAAEACFAETHRQLGLDLELRYCPHPAGAPKCFCRKPMPGFGVEFIERHHLDPAACLFVGDLPSDARFAAACGFRYHDAADFFAEPPDPA